MWHSLLVEIFFPILFDFGPIISKPTYNLKIAPYLNYLLRIQPKRCNSILGPNNNFLSENFLFNFIKLFRIEISYI